jgi:TubC N-terminal docking domain
MKLLEKLTSMGINVAIDSEDCLDLDAPVGLLTPDLLAEIRMNKTSILKELRRGVLDSNIPGTNGQIAKGTRAGKIFVPRYFGTNEVQIETDTIAALENLYPNPLPAQMCEQIVQAVKLLNRNQQIDWWCSLARWLSESTAGDLGWRCSLFDKLADEWDASP